MFHLIGTSNTKKLVQRERDNLSTSRTTGISGLSINNPLEHKNLIKVLEKLGSNNQYILNHDVINNSITDFYETEGLTESAFFATLPQLRQLGVVAVVLHQREGAPSFVLDKEHVVRQHFTIIRIKRALGNDWRTFFRENNNVEKTHIPKELEMRFTRHVLQRTTLDDLMNVNKIKHKHRMPGAGSKARQSLRYF